MTSRFRGAADQFGIAYDRRATDYAAAIAPTFGPVHHRIVELAQIRPGMRVVDLATGTGGVAREAAAAGAHVTGRLRPDGLGGASGRSSLSHPDSRRTTVSRRRNAQPRLSLTATLRATSPDSGEHTIPR